MTESPSALLERAAIHLAALSNDATPGPWRYNPSKHHRQPGTVCFSEAVFAGPAGTQAICVATTGETDDVPSQSDAAWIATVNPAVARPLFTWLKNEAMMLARYAVTGEPEDRLPEHTRAALEFARQVLGEEVDRG